jgi:hypothetical protein
VAFSNGSLATGARDRAAAGAGIRVLLGVGNDDPPTDGLNPERRVVGRQRRVAEGTRALHRNDPLSVDALGAIVRRYRTAELNALAAPTMSSSTIAAAGLACLTMPALWPA